jgi:hypothetical protein
MLGQLLTRYVFRAAPGGKEDPPVVVHVQERCLGFSFAQDDEHLRVKTLI